MDGRVKTLHPKVHGGLLGVRDKPEHVAAMEEHEIAPIDLVVVNLYPFLNTVMSGADRDTIIENIDIGGPSMVRSAAKNHAHVAIVTDPADYAALLEQLDANGGTTLEFRKKLAAKAYALTAAYDSTISQWFAFADQGERWPETWTLASKLKMPLRYGENPHQQAALYLPVGPPRAASPRRAGPGQGAQLQQFERRQCRARAGLRVPRRRADDRHRQARKSLRRRHARAACSSVARGARLRQRLGIRRDRRREPAARRRNGLSDHRDLHRSRRRSRRRRGGKAIFARKKNLRLLLTGELPDPARGGADHCGDCRRNPRPGSRQRHGHARPAQMRDEAPADRAGTRRLPVRLDRRQARQVERNRLCEGRSHRRHRRGPDEPPRQRAHCGDPRHAKPPRPTAGPSRARSARRSRRTPSSPSPTACSPPPKPARPRSSSPADRSATRK